MQKVDLGRTGLSIAPIVFGGNVFGWTADKATSFELIDRFLDRGFDCIDTADVYSAWVDGNEGGESETVIGEWIASRGRRDEIVLMSKVGMWEKRKGLSEANILRAVEDSLRRLNTDYLDVYFAHLDDADTPLEVTLGAFEKLKAAGKIRVLGASNYSAQRLDEALRLAGTKSLPAYEVLQPHYNLYTREKFEGPLENVATEHGLGVVPYFALASGFLTGKYRSAEDLGDRARASRVEPYMDDRGMRLLDALDEVAGETGASPAQVALAWLIGKRGVTAPIASATSAGQLDQTLDAAELTLDAAAMARLDAAGA